jgi:hypothetical protein
MSCNVLSKDPDSIEPYFFVWCSLDGTNDGSADDSGELQGATISSQTLTGTGVTVDSDNSNAVTLQGISYGVNTVSAAWLSAGTANTNATLHCQIVTSDSRTLEKSMTIPIREA